MDMTRRASSVLASIANTVPVGMRDAQALQKLVVAMAVSLRRRAYVGIPVPLGDKAGERFLIEHDIDGCTL